MLRRHSFTSAVAAFCVIVALALAISSTASAATKVYVENDFSFTGSGAPDYKPTSISFGTGSMLSNIKYSSYGGTQARATGTCGYKKFKAEGGSTWISFPVTIVFSRIKVKHGYHVYTQRTTTRTVHGNPQQSPYC